MPLDEPRRRRRPLPRTIRESERYYKRAFADDTGAGEVLAKTDLYYLLRHVTTIGKRVEHPWLFDRCREVQNSPDGHLDLWAREHYKSTIITFGMTLLDIINNQEITIGIFSHTRDISRAFLRQLKREME